MLFKDITPQEYPHYYEGYFSLLDKETPLIESLEISLHDLIHFVQNIPMDKFDYRYEPGKWTIKEIIQHLIDTERVFSYRALCIARGDKTHFPSFDENSYADHSKANSRHLKDILMELSLVRHATISLFKSFTAEMLLEQGTASVQNHSVRAIGFMLLAHQAHHKKIYQERYL